MSRPASYDQRSPGTGDFTGKCWHCGSRNLWDDEAGYGCNDCGMIRFTTERRVVRINTSRNETR